MNKIFKWTVLCAFLVQHSFPILRAEEETEMQSEPFAQEIMVVGDSSEEPCIVSDESLSLEEQPEADDLVEIVIFSAQEDASKKTSAVSDEALSLEESPESDDLVEIVTISAFEEPSVVSDEALSLEEQPEAQLIQEIILTEVSVESVSPTVCENKPESVSVAFITTEEINNNERVYVVAESKIEPKPSRNLFANIAVGTASAIVVVVSLILGTQ